MLLNLLGRTDPYLILPPAAALGALHQAVADRDQSRRATWHRVFQRVGVLRPPPQFGCLDESRFVLPVPAAPSFQDADSA